jgi:hypothetical protein
LHRFKEAAEEYRRTIALKPDHAGAHANLGSALLDQGLVEESLEVLSSAQHLFQRDALISTNLGNALRDAGRYEEAFGALQRAIELMPQAPIPRWNLASVQLLLGRFSEGWAGYRYHQAAENFPTLPLPIWDGSDPSGKRLLLYTNQGLGDIIQCVRYIPLLSSRATIYLGLVASQSPVRRLLEGKFGIAQIIGEAEPFPPVDSQFLLDALPAVFGTTPQRMPGPVPYLSADPAMAQRWGQRLSGIAGLKVGIAWAGNSRQTKDHFRSIAPELLAPLGDVARVQWINLQKRDPQQPKSAAPDRPQLLDWTAEFQDLADAAALIANLDLVITVDSAIAHLAGALGKPTWLLLQFSPDWRWLLERADCPWYPTMRIFRQRRLRDWKTTIEEVETELRALAPALRAIM